MRSLLIVTAGRVVIYLICAGVVVYLVQTVRERSRGLTPIASHELNTHDKIMPGDVQTKQTARLIGHYLRSHVDAGGSVTSAMVSDRPLPPPLPNAVAVIVATPANIVSKRQLEKGTLVVIMRGVHKLAEGAVIATQCDSEVCAVIVELEKPPDFDSAALAGAEVLPVPLPPPGL